ncbi:thiamine diphosphokinase [Hasllibacter halocynthiae]|uniref:Thiamine diphosphokinase n=1 Tax=Hasllibacter halocynthiae TaxID=595589 RepID=A0A2T0X6Z9_9RHOB|nr:thiamine diphosphokinase [Hasllibacter halocynthiae]PRY94697.1 thiamine diphosphokinase [Hasllibacter halocynthiae]
MQRGGDPPPVLTAAEPVALVGAGPPDGLRAVLSRAGPVVAADGGAAACLAAGRVPDAVIGDLDSLDGAARAAIPAGRVHRIATQDDTDFEKAMAHVRAPLVLGAGFLGGRVDHALAALGALPRLRPCILVGLEDCACALPAGETRLDLPPGTRVSLFPMGPVTGTSEGLEWPIDGLALRPAGRVGTSNRAKGPVRLRMDGAGCLLILPAAALDAMIGARLRAAGGGFAALPPSAPSG